jgi:hypothetical protein
MIIQRVNELDEALEEECEILIKEATEIKLILSAIINKSAGS